MPSPTATFSVLCGAYVVAWLVGLVNSGRVGVRELVLQILLKGLVEESDLLLAVLLGERNDSGR